MTIYSLLAIILMLALGALCFLKSKDILMGFKDELKDGLNKKEAPEES